MIKVIEQRVGKARVGGGTEKEKRGEKAKDRGKREKREGKNNRVITWRL